MAPKSNKKTINKFASSTFTEMTTEYNGHHKSSSVNGFLLRVSLLVVVKLKFAHISFIYIYIAVGDPIIKREFGITDLTPL